MAKNLLIVKKSQLSRAGGRLGNAGERDVGSHQNQEIVCKQDSVFLAVLDFGA
jgi:hypothetical protein